MKKWTIEIIYPVNPDKGSAFKARAPYQIEADDIAEAYKKAEAAFADRPDVRFGWILPGHHMGAP